MIEMQRLDCWVCCQEMQYHAVGSCGHNDMCIRCALRLRILLKDYKCPICKATLDRVLITNNPNRTLEEYPTLSLTEGEQGFLFENREAMEIMQKLTTFACWLRGCEKVKVKSFTQANLKKHIETYHKLRFCDICLKSRIVFLCEQKLYTIQELEKHIQTGDEEVAGHPECLFCRTRFFDDQDLRRHLQERHFSCGVCEGCNTLFYENYEKLQRHFTKAHYFCQDEVCLQNRFVVFRSYIEFHHHNVSLHVDKTGMTKVQRDQLQQIPLVQEQPELPNTEAVDFRTVFEKNNAEENKSEHQAPRGPNYIVRRKPPAVPDYRNVFPRTQNEMKNLIRDAVNHDQTRFQQVLQATKDYNTNRITAEQFTDRFMELVGPVQGEPLFPILITTLKTPERQEALHRVYAKLMEGKNNVTTDGRCSNELADCKNEGSVMKALQSIIEKELKKRLKDTSRTRPFFIHPSLLLQMATIIDKLEDVQMIRFAYILNFGVGEDTKQRLMDMLESASDLSFCSRLTTKFEDHFLGPIDSFEIYLISKYVDMCTCKLKGLPFKHDAATQQNLEEEKSQPGQPVATDSKTDSGTEESKWGEDRRKKAPINSEKHFPALASPATVASAQPQNTVGSWGRGTPVGLKKDEVSIKIEEFPSLQSGPTLVPAPIEEGINDPVPTASDQSGATYGFKSVTISKGKGKKKKDVVVLRL